MAPKMKTEEQNIETATSMIRAYIQAMVRANPDDATFRVTDIRRRLYRSAYECYLDAVIAALTKEGLIKTYPESMDSLVYLVRRGEGDA